MVSNAAAVVVVVVADELIDCMDADCCMDVRCTNHEYCSAAPDPMEILLSKQPPKNTASFFERVKFLVGRDSVQINANQQSFIDSYVASRLTRDTSL